MSSFHANNEPKASDLVPGGDGDQAPFVVAAPPAVQGAVHVPAPVVFRSNVVIEVPDVVQGNMAVVAAAEAPITDGLGVQPIGIMRVEVRPRVATISSPKKHQVVVEAKQRIEEAKKRGVDRASEAPRRLEARHPSPPGDRSEETCRARQVAVDLSEVTQGLARRTAKHRLTSPQRERQEHLRALPAKKPRRSSETRAVSSSSESSIIKAPAEYEVATLKKKLEKAEAALVDEKKRTAAEKEKAEKYKARACRAGDELDRMLPKREKLERAEKEARETARKAEEELLALREQPAQYREELKVAQEKNFSLAHELRELKQEFELAKLELKKSKDMQEKEKARADKAEESAERLRIQIREMSRRALLSPTPAAAQPAIDHLEPLLSEGRSRSPTPDTLTPEEARVSPPGSPGALPLARAVQAVADMDEEEATVEAVQNPLPIADPIMAQPRAASPPPPAAAAHPADQHHRFAGPGKCQCCSSRITQRMADRRAMAARVRPQPPVDAAVLDMMRRRLGEAEDLLDCLLSHVEAATIAEEMLDPEVHEFVLENQRIVTHLNSILQNPRRIEASRLTTAIRIEQLKERVYDHGILTDRRTRIPPPTVHTTVLRDATVAVIGRPRSVRAAAIAANTKIIKNW